MKINTDNIKIRDVLERGVEEIVDKISLEKKLSSGKKLRIKHGIDPTGPKIHLGRASQLWKLRSFQELGHQVVLIIGDFTAQIGDASDKKALRKILSEKEIKSNMKNYVKQIGKILDMNMVELHYNSEWFNKFNIKSLLSISQRFTAQQMIQRRNFKERWDQGKPIGLHELFYPLLQGYDSVAIKADVEIGGSDQLFNLKSGRDVQDIFKQPRQDIMTLKMIFGLDGRKMSTSWGNVITIIDKPEEMYGKIMSMKDSLILNYFELCTRLSLGEDRNMQPRDLKAFLAREIVSIYHSKKLAIKAEEEFNRIFRKKEIPDKIKEINFKVEEINIIDLLKEAELTSSRAESRRLISQGGVSLRVDGKKNIISDWKKTVKLKKGMIVQVGKRKFIKILR